MAPTFKEERKLWKKGYKFVVGLDEAGRGALAGPVIAGAVMLKLSYFCSSSLPFEIKNLKDSKKLSQKQREKWYRILKNCPAIIWSTASVPSKIIDKINVLEATKLAMKQAIKNLEKKIKISKFFSKNKKEKKNFFLILDGNFKLNLKIPQKSIIRADEKVLSCTLASIFAKVKRDDIMKKYSQKYPCYLFEKNKGYPTKNHKIMIKKYGACCIHRFTFLS